MQRQPIGQTVLVGILLASTIVLGIALRLEDPLRTQALGAEDPFSHLVFMKEWLKQGYFADAFHMGTEMYPPGMHAFVMAFVPYAGVEFYDFARIAPAVFGGLAILGMYVLASRLAGAVAGLGAAFITAIMPEHIFRSELFFPTTFDLALLPIWLLAFHFALEGERIAGSVLFLGASIPLAIMHPWLVPLFAAPLGLYAALRALRTDARPFAPAVCLLALPVAFAMSFRWETSDTGFADFLGHLPGMAWLAQIEVRGILLFLILLVILGALAAVGAALVALASRIRLPRAARIVVSALAAAGLLLLVPLLTRDPPRDVNYVHMLGVVALTLALAGAALAFVRPTTLGDLALSIVIFLLPLTALNIFDSPYWPQRTVAFLSVGIALLAGSTLGHVHGVIERFAPEGRARSIVAPAALVALALCVAGTSAATGGGSTYPWYRMYNDDQLVGFENAAWILGQHEGSRVFLYTWQPALLIKVYTDPEKVWYSPDFFRDAAERAEKIERVHGTAYVLVDKHTQRAADQGKADLAFLDEPRYEVVYESADGGILLYEVSR